MELSISEKINIIDEHIKNINVSIYNFNILLMQEESLDIVNQDAIDSLNLQISNAFSKKTILENEKNTLSEQGI